MKEFQNWNEISTYNSDFAKLNNPSKSCFEQQRFLIRMLGHKADVPVSRQSSTQIQLEATIQSAHALLKAGMVEQATRLLAAFSPKEVNG